MNIKELFKALLEEDTSMEVRIGDVAEGDELHCSVGRVIRRGSRIIIVPGDDDIWYDETVATEVLAEELWPEEKE